MLASFSLDRPGASEISRRDFVRFCSIAAAAVGLGPLAGEDFVRAAERGAKPSVIWLQFQECTGCTESLLRTTHPGVDDLIFDLISLDYHETLFAAAGHQAEAALKSAMEAHAGNYVCIVEGAIPTKEDGIYCMIGGRTALEIVNDVASRAGAVIAIGSCASWGGVPSAGPNPTGSVGVHEILEGKTVVNIRTTCSAPCSSTPLMERSRNSTRRTVRSGHTAGPSTSTVRDARISMRDGSRKGTATRGTAWDIVSTSSDAKDRRRTRTARC